MRAIAPWLALLTSGDQTSKSSSTLAPGARAESERLVVWESALSLP